MILKNRIFKLGILLLINSTIYTQNINYQACDPETPNPTDRCYSTCLLCDLNGLTGNMSAVNNNPYSSSLQDCYSSVGPIYAFIAYSQELVIEISAQNCINSSGGEIRPMYFIGYTNPQNISCDNPNQIPIFPCSEIVSNEMHGSHAVFTEESKTFTANNLNVGGIYFIGFHSYGGSLCDYSLTVLSGTTVVPELAPADFSGPDTLCAGEIGEYLVADPQPGANYYFTLDGDTVARRTDLFVREWPTAGSYELCVLSDNVCHRSPPACRTILVGAPSQTTSQDFLCAGDCYALPNGGLVCEPGDYTFVLPNRLGCDSTVTLSLIAAALDTTRLAPTICAGDNLFFVGDTLTQPGQYTYEYQNSTGCDSTVIVDLDWQPCAYPTFVTGQPPSCAGATDGVIRFSTALPAIFPATYVVELIGEGVWQSGTVDAPSDTVQLSGLAEGTYLITFTDQSGNQSVANRELIAPLPLFATLVTSNYNDYGVSCHAAADGSILLTPGGGTPPYGVAWADGNDAFQRPDLTAGSYAFTLTDANGCIYSGSQSLSAPPPLTLNLTITPTDCDSPDFGALASRLPGGGVMPYEWLLQNQDGMSLTDANYDRLPAAAYQLRLTDRNGCALDTTFTIGATPVPIISLNASDSLIDLGETLTLSTTGTNVDSLSWSPAIDDGCPACSRLNITPTGSLTVTATAYGSGGCAVSDSVRVLVQPNDRVYLPTAFSPNFDGINDHFAAFSGLAVAGYGRLSIHDRWGGLVFESTEPSADESPRWDGTDGRGRRLPPGTYIYRLPVRFLDGRQSLLTGAVTLIR